MYFIIIQQKWQQSSKAMHTHTWALSDMYKDQGLYSSIKISDPAQEKKWFGKHLQVQSVQCHWPRMTKMFCQWSCRRCHIPASVCTAPRRCPFLEVAVIVNVWARNLASHFHLSTIGILILFRASLMILVRPYTYIYFIYENESG